MLVACLCDSRLTSPRLQALLQRWYQLLFAGLEKCAIVCRIFDSEPLESVPSVRRRSWGAFATQISSRSGLMRDFGTLPQDLSEQLLVTDFESFRNMLDFVNLNFMSIADPALRRALMHAFFVRLQEINWLHRQLFPRLAKNSHVASVRRCLRAFMSMDGTNRFWHNYDEPERADSVRQQVVADGMLASLEIWGIAASICGFEGPVRDAMNQAAKMISSQYGIVPPVWESSHGFLETRLKRLQELSVAGKSLVRRMAPASREAYSNASADDAARFNTLFSDLDVAKSRRGGASQAQASASLLPYVSKSSDVQGEMFSRTLSQPVEGFGEVFSKYDLTSSDAEGEPDDGLAVERHQSAIPEPPVRTPTPEDHPMPEEKLPPLRPSLHKPSAATKRRSEHITDELGLDEQAHQRPAKRPDHSDRSGTSTPALEDEEEPIAAQPRPKKEKEKKVDPKKKAGKQSKDTGSSAAGSSGSRARPSQQAAMPASAFRADPEATDALWRMRDR